MTKFRCVVATPTVELYAGDVEYASIPGIEGSFGVLAGHEQFVGLTRPGLLTLTIDEAGTDKRVFVLDEGIAQVFNNHLSVLAQLGRALDDIDIEDTQRKRDAAVADLDEIMQKGDDARVDAALAKTREDYIAWCNLQIKAKRDGII
jgi:F-type H+-transporting ATPase subunit epsilon